MTTVDLLSANHDAGARLRQAKTDVSAAIITDRVPDWDAYRTAADEVTSTLHTVLDGVEHDAEVETVEGTMTVCAVTVTEQRLPSDATITVTVTGDGGSVIREWHRGDDADEPVFYETYARRAGRWGRVSHGWIHPTTRRIVQTG